ncbi:hypothetical protein L1887_32637 [Cichorium endivia]|nr:hypothetical protein L1887_32637 [Cichorium endivia]
MADRRSVFDRMGPTGRNGDRFTDETLNAKNVLPTNVANVRKVGPPVRNIGSRNYADVLQGGLKDTVLNEKVDAEGEDECFMNNDGDDLAKDGRSEDDDGESVHVSDSFANDNREGVKSPLDDPFGLDDLIRNKVDVNNCCSKEMANDNSFPPGFTPPFVARERAVRVDCQERMTQQHSPHVVPSPVIFSPLSDQRSRQAIASDDEQECGVRRVASWKDSVGGMRTKPHGSRSLMNFREGEQDDDCQSVIGPLDGVFGTQSANADSMIPPKPPVDVLSLMDQFNRFIEMGQASGLHMSGCEKDLKIFLKKIGAGDVFK